MTMKKFLCLVAALLLVPTIAAADDFSAALSGGGGAQGIASIVTGGGSVSYTVVTAGIGNVTGAEIRQGGGTFVNLNASSSTGSAAGTVNTGADLSALEANPGNFSVRVTGTGGSVEGPLQFAGESGGGGGGEPGVISIAGGDVAVSEQVGSVAVMVIRSGGGGEVSVDYATADGSATAGADYTAAGGTLTWADGDTAPKTVQVAITDDGDQEPAETFTFAISNPTGGAALGDSGITVTIGDNDTPCDGNDPATLCLRNDRFEVSASFETPQGQTGTAMAGGITGDTGYLWFFNDQNVEVVVKVLNACTDPFNRYWVFAGGLTNVKVDLRVRDTSTGDVVEYTNPLRTQFQPIQDTDAFATCP